MMPNAFDSSYAISLLEGYQVSKKELANHPFLPYNILNILYHGLNIDAL